jgi:hypothetical protein
MITIPLSIINIRTNQETAITTNQAYLNKNPDFQREYEAWDDKLKTRFIETMLIGRAMNPIWTILNPDDSSEEVLDGMHRLTTALDYLNGRFKLNGKFFTDLERGMPYDKKFFNDLSPDDKHKIRNYSFIFNQLDSSYKTDINKRRDMYEILNRSTKTLTDYEFDKVLYSPFFDLIVPHKNELNSLFFNKKDQRGELETEIIELLVLSYELPSSWSSINNLKSLFNESKLGNTQQSVEIFMQNKSEEISNKLIMIIKIIKKLKDNKFFDTNKKIFNTLYLPYKFIISRLLYKFNDDVLLFNRHIIDIIHRLKEEITNKDINIREKLNCTSRNASFQKKLIHLIDNIIHNSYESNKDRRLFKKNDISQKLNEQNNVCNICRLSKENYEGDHIISWSKGGKTSYDNLQVICKNCHINKNDSIENL